MTSVKDAFDLTGRVAIITGGAGLLGVKHAEAIAEMGGIPVLLDLDGEKAQAYARAMTAAYGVQSLGLCSDITQPEPIMAALSKTLDAFRRVDILINNAANNPKVEGDMGSQHWSRLESFPLDVWNQDLAVGLTGAFLCSQIIGSEMARRGKGVILNIASDLAVIAPDQRIYRQAGLSEEQQPVKPVSYSVVKAGLLGLTRYLATYWADKGVRVNALSPGGVYNRQDEAFVQRLTNLIPLQRMADQDEYKAAIVFLVSDASAYMTGANLIVNGGRTCW
jgi:NAD(P)-dependent dehydrogenase (short-subunit alcohol dehydrogenase family)